MRQVLVRQADIPGFPYFVLVRLPLAVHTIAVVAWPHGLVWSVAAMAMLICWAIQPFAVVIAVIKSRKAGATKALLPNVAIFCGCLQIAMLVWMLEIITRDIN